jgi:hypothetical protein
MPVVENFITPLPVTTPVCVWTGSNAAEMSAFAARYSQTFTDNGDGTFNYADVYNNMVIGSGISPSQGMYPDQFNGQQIVTGEAPIKYAVTYQIPAQYVAPARRSKSVPVPALTLLGKTTINVTWDNAMPNTSYDVMIVPVGAATLVGALSWALVAGSVTTSGCQVAVSAALALTLGQMQLQLTAVAR